MQRDTRVHALHCIKLAECRINSQMFVTRRKNVMQRNVRIGSKSILALCCVVVGVNASMMQCIAGPIAGLHHIVNPPLTPTITI